MLSDEDMRMFSTLRRGEHLEHSINERPTVVRSGVSFVPKTSLEATLLITILVSGSAAQSTRTLFPFQLNKGAISHTHPNGGKSDFDL